MDIKQRILESPTFKAAAPSVLAAAIGVFSGSLVTEITSPAGIVWSLFYKTVSFYVLLGLSALQVWLSRLIFEQEREISRFADSEYCVAYIRSKCLPEVASKYQERIRTGEGGELKQAMDELREVLK